MITIDVLVNQTVGLSRADVEFWVRNDWVRPKSVGDELSFGEIDVARVILIHTLHGELEVNDEALPVVLSLIDQLYDLRRQMRHISEVMQEGLPADLRAKVRRGLAARNS
jgi:chaperone modulatory protein CbpM